MRKTILIILILISLLAGGIGGYVIFKLQNPNFEKLNPDEMHKRIVIERDRAIGRAMAMGDYKCCINPPCTMCYMEANEWNNFTAGTCACDDLIAQGKEPCPQCERGVVKNTGYSCEITSENCENN